MKDRDEVAEEMFDAPYHHLSAWGQREVDRVIAAEVIPDTPRTATLHNAVDPAKLRQDNERLGRELESARMENLDLWDENTELKSELEELKAQFNPPRQKPPRPLDSGKRST